LNLQRRYFANIDNFIKECGSQSLQMALRDLDSAYSRYGMA